MKVEHTGNDGEEDGGNEEENPVYFFGEKIYLKISAGVGNVVLIVRGRSHRGAPQKS